MLLQLDVVFRIYTEKGWASTGRTSQVTSMNEINLLNRLACYVSILLKWYKVVREESTRRQVTIDWSIISTINIPPSNHWLSFTVQGLEIAKGFLWLHRCWLRRNLHNLCSTRVESKGKRWHRRESDIIETMIERFDRYILYFLREKIKRERKKRAKDWERKRKRGMERMW